MTSYYQSHQDVEGNNVYCSTLWKLLNHLDVSQDSQLCNLLLSTLKPLIESRKFHAHVKMYISFVFVFLTFLYVTHIFCLIITQGGLNIV